MDKTLIHPSSEVATKHVGSGTRIWQNVVVLEGARIGCNCNLCANTFVENDVVVGDNVTLKCGVFLWDGVRVGNDVFIGPNAVFCNDKYPRSGVHDERRHLSKTIIGEGASIGAGSVILPGVKIGAYAMVGAGAVVAKDVPSYAIVVGNPARINGYVNAKKVQERELVNSRDVTESDRFSSQTGARLYSIPHFVDLRGDLNVLEFEKILPFPVRRIFYTYNVGSSEVRGEHSHKVCEQFLIAVKGSLKVVVDDVTTREEYLLDSPSVGLHLPAGCWGIQYQHSSDCVLMVLASHLYDEKDYIKDYTEFKAYREGLK